MTYFTHRDPGDEDDRVPATPGFYLANLGKSEALRLTTQLGAYILRKQEDGRTYRLDGGSFTAALVTVNGSTKDGHFKAGFLNTGRMMEYNTCHFGCIVTIITPRITAIERVK